MSSLNEALHWHRTGAALVQGFLLAAAVVTVALRVCVIGISGRVSPTVPIFSRVGLIPLWPNVLAVSHPSGSKVKGQVTFHAFCRRNFIPAGRNWCHWNDIPQLVMDVAVCKMVFRGRGHDSHTKEAAGEASPAAIDAPDTRTILLGHQRQFVKQSNDATGVGRVCRPAPVVGIVGRLFKGWRLVPGLVCYPVTLDADGGGGMPMGKTKKGRSGPGKERELREFGRQDAAPQKAPDEKSTECSHHTEVPSDLPRK